MSGVVSYELLQSKLGTGLTGFTNEGGIYTIYVNNTGTSVKGTLVIASTSVSNGVDIAPANTQMPIGAIYENGVANGELVKVVICGKAQVLLKNGQASTLGYWCGVSDVNGRMYQSAAPPTTAVQHNRQVGHSLESKVSGTNVLSMVTMHFN